MPLKNAFGNEGLVPSAGFSLDVDFFFLKLVIDAKWLAWGGTLQFQFPHCETIGRPAELSGDDAETARQRDCTCT
eukprot:COSAG06_NODE_10527_length_1665_cov_1.035760_2_plen_75_part_00